MNDSEECLKSPISYRDWHLKMADVVAERSKDPSTKVGAVIIDPDERPVAYGYNGFPRGVRDLKSRWERPYKYDFVCHAEHNAIEHSRMRGDISGSTIYLTHFPPCQNCAKMIVQAGIKKVVSRARRISKHSDVQCVATLPILSEAGVEAVVVGPDGHEYPLADYLEWSKDPAPPGLMPDRV